MANQICVGETHIQPQWIVTDENGNPISLQGATVTTEWKSQAGVEFTGGGTATVSATSPYNVVTYKLVTADTATPGTYLVKPIATFADGSLLTSISAETVVVALA